MERVKKNKLDKVTKYFLFLIIFGVVLQVGFSYVMGYLTHDPVEKYLHVQELQYYVEDNKLQLGFYGNPFEEKIEENKVLQKIQAENFEKLFSSDVETFTEYYTQNYIYEENTYNCKYWAYVWTYYYYYNHDKFKAENITHQLVVTENHVFVMFSSLEGYCFIDSGYITCMGEVGDFEEN
ncbi:MAG: hypothetical protein ACOC22_01800 [bacterium]